MSGISQAEVELNEMVDDGVRIDVLDRGDGAYALAIRVEDEGCAECLVPDAMLAAIATDALERGGASVSSVSVEHDTATEGPAPGL